MTAAPYHQDKLPLRQAIPAILLVTGVYLINYICRGIVGPLLVDIEKDLGIGHMEATSMLLYIAIGLCTSMFFTGFIVSRLQPRNVVALSCFCCGVALCLISRIDSLFSACALFTLFGAATGIYFTAGMAVLASFSRPENWSYTIAMHEAAPPTGFILSPIIATYTAMAWGWRASFCIVGSIAILYAALFAVCGKGGRELADKPSAAGIGNAFHSSLFLLFIWLLVLGISAEYAPFSVLPLSLTSEQGLSPAEASNLLAQSRLLSLIAVFCGGWAATRLGIGKTLLLSLLINGAALVLMALPISATGLAAARAAMTAQALAPAFMFPALFSIIARVFPAGQQAMLLSVSMPIGVVAGTGVIPFLLGICGTYLSFAQGFLLLGIFNLATIPFLRIFRGKV